MTSLLRRFHADTRGFMHLLTGVLLLVIIAALALVINTGRATSSKMHMQTAADAAAHSAAVVTSRTVNLVTATNINIVRTGSAEALAWAVWPTVAEIVDNWEEAISSAGWFAPVVAARIAALEAPQLAKFIAKAGPTGARQMASRSLIKRIKKINTWQKDILAATPGIVEDQRAKIEDFYGVQIKLAQLGSSDGRVRAPVRSPRGMEERLLTIAYLLEQRIKTDRQGWDGTLSRIHYGRGSDVWARWTSAMGALVAFDIRGRFIVLDTHDGFMEKKPKRQERNYAFAVTAIARHPEGLSEPRVFSGLNRRPFNRTGSAMAIAQAETFHLADEGQQIPFHWRVWSTCGWQWQPRLTFARALPKLLERDRALADWFDDIGSPNYDPRALEDLTQH